MRYMKDEIDILPIEYDSCEIKSPYDHKLLFKALENPLRRRVIKSIGESGKSKNDIINEIGIDENQLKFQLDYLIKECFAEVNEDIYKLNEKGIDELLKNIVTPNK